MQVATTICNFLTFHWRVTVLCIFVLSYLHNTYVKNIIQNNISYILYIVLCKATYNQWPKFPALKNPFSYFWVGIPTYCVHRKEKSYSPNEIPPHTITYIQKNQYCGVAKYYMYATIRVWIEKKKKTHFLGGSTIITSWLVLFLKVHYSS